MLDEISPESSVLVSTFSSKITLDEEFEEKDKKMKEKEPKRKRREESKEDKTLHHRRQSRKDR